MRPHISIFNSCVLSTLVVNLFADGQLVGGMTLFAGRSQSFLEKVGQFLPA